MFFLTDIDPRAAVKGSRDPLGLVPVWQRFGRSVVGNLTTATGSFRGFTTLLLGLHFADEVLKAGGHDESERVLAESLPISERSLWHASSDVPQARERARPVR